MSSCRLPSSSMMMASIDPEESKDWEGKKRSGLKITRKYGTIGGGSQMCTSCCPFRLSRA